MVKLGLLAALVVWASDQPGRVEIAWQSYNIAIHPGFLVLAILVFIGVIVLGNNIFNFVVHLPARLRERVERKAHDRAIKNITLGMSAIAAGDLKLAKYHTHKAEGLINPDSQLGRGLHLLLKAQTYRLDGEETRAHDMFERLLSNKDTAFMGFRGLVQGALTSGNHEEALKIAEKALVQNKKSAVLNRMVYDQQIALHRWADALETLTSKARYLDIDPAIRTRDMVALHMAIALEAMPERDYDKAMHHAKKAKALDKNFMPAERLFMKVMMAQSQHIKAMRHFKTVWRRMPHPSLISLWVELYNLGGQPMNEGYVMWMKNLLDVNADSPHAHLAAAWAAYDNQMLGEARVLLFKSIDLHPYQSALDLLERLQREFHTSDHSFSVYRDKLTNAQPQETWVCRNTGRVEEQWKPMLEPGGHFNTLYWGVPGVYALQGYQFEAASLDFLTLPSS